MKIKNTFIALAVLAGMTAAAQAQTTVNLTLTGSTAFRNFVLDRVMALYDAGVTVHTDSANKITYSYSGTMSNVVAGATVNIRTFWSGSASGFQAVQFQTNMPVVDVSGSLTPGGLPGDLGLCDVANTSISPTVPLSSFASYEQVAVVPFMFFGNADPANSPSYGATNITREQAQLLMTASNPSGGFPGSFIGATGASSANGLALVGRSTDSGTRVGTEKCIAFVGSPTLWLTNGAGAWVASAGAITGGSLVKDVLNPNYAGIGYVGLQDYLGASAPSQLHALSYEGVPLVAANNTTPLLNNVIQGQYPIWTVENLATSTHLNANQTTVAAALRTLILDPVGQGTNVNFTNWFIRLADMQVTRGTDGGKISSNNF